METKIQPAIHPSLYPAIQPAAKNKITWYMFKILRLRIIFDKMIRSNHYKDVAFRFIHYVLSALMPILILVENLANKQELCSSENESHSLFAISVIVFILLRVKESLKYDKVKRLAKEQLAKYIVLYRSIEAELRKDAFNRKSDNDFIYWIERELQYIERDDPEIPKNIDIWFKTYCQENNITVRETIDELKTLQHDVNIAISKYDDEQKADLSNIQSNNELININNMATNQQASQLNLSDKSDQTPEFMLTKPEDDLSSYKKEIKNIDNKQYEDVDWCLDRLSKL